MKPMKPTCTPTPSVLLATAVLAARRAGTHALNQRSRRHEANLVARHDVKLRLDVECQEIATQTVLACFPDHAVLGEEDTPEQAAAARTSPYEWIIDPIDGTVNFFHGNPYWCCSVAVRRADEMVAGCVYAPSMGLLFEGAAGESSRCNGEVAKVSSTQDLTTSNVHTGADKDAKPGSEPFRFFHRIAALVQRPRIFGAAALDICLVASGGADAYFEPSIYIWDIAAADLILRGAGGTGSILRQWSRHRMAYLASNGRVHAPLATALEPLFGEG